MRAIKNLIGASLISIAIFIVWFSILPDYNERPFLESSAQSRLADLDAKNKLISRVEELDKEYQTRYAELKRLSLVVPSEQHLEELITIIEDIFLATGMPLTDISLSVRENSSDFSLVGMEFRFTTTYDSIINFLNVIEKSLRLIDITSLDISINKEIALSQGISSLGVVMNANSYFMSKIVPVKTIIKKESAAEE